MRVLVVYCHPVPDSYCAALRDAVIASLRSRGYEVRLTDLYAEKFNPVLSEAERRTYNERASGEPDLQAHYENIRWAEALIFVYPTWWYGLPAMLKGWLERVFVLDVAFQLSPTAQRIVPLLKHIKRLGIVTTCGAPWWLSFLMGQPGRKTLLRGIWTLCSNRRMPLYLAHYDMDRSTPESRTRFLEKVKLRVGRW